LLKREKQRIEKEVEKLIPHLENMDDVLYGQNMFGLEANDEGLNHIQDMNLRPEMYLNMNNKPLIH